MWIKRSNLVYEERNIESWKSDVYDKNKSYLDRWFAIKELERLLNEEDFKEIQTVKDEIIEELNIL